MFCSHMSFSCRRSRCSATHAEEGNRTQAARFEYALSDTDGDPVVKHYPVSIVTLRNLKTQPVNIGGEVCKAAKDWAPRDLNCNVFTGRSVNAEGMM
jgi:hypothetical protein